MTFISIGRTVCCKAPAILGVHNPRAAPRISVASVLETGIVLETRRGEAARPEFDLFLHRAKIEIIPVDTDQVEMARLAWRRYGRGRHPAALNFGDCFAYALAKKSGEPLLAKWSDLAQTNINIC